MCLWLCCVARDSFDPYATLGVRRSASSDEVRAAYRRLARQYHPDKNKGSDAQNRFVEISKAHEILSDPQSRREWDSGGRWRGGASARRGRHPTGSPTHARRAATEGIPGVIRLSDNMYDSMVLGGGDDAVGGSRLWLIFVHAVWCSPCARALPGWREAAAAGRSGAFRAADVVVDYDYGLAQRLAVRRPPAIVAIRVGPRGQETRRVLRLRALASPLRSSEVLDFAKKVMSDEDRVATGSSGGSREVRIWLHRHRGRVRVLAVSKSRRKRPHLSIYYASMRLPNLRFLHVSPDQCETAVSATDAPNAQEAARAACGSGDAALIIVRESGWPIEVLGRQQGLTAKPRELEGLLRVVAVPHVPKLDGENYYDYCYRFAHVPGAGDDDDEDDADDAFCVISLAGSELAAHRALKTLALGVRGGASYDGGGPQLGWVMAATQREFLGYFSKRFQKAAPELRRVVAVRPATGEYAVLSATSPSGLRRWVRGLREGSVRFQRERGAPPPFLADETNSGLGAFDIDSVSDWMASILTSGGSKGLLSMGVSMIIVTLGAAVMLKGVGDMGAHARRR